MKVLVIGGSGTFGQRIARLLAEAGGFEIVIAGRDLARAERVAATLNVRATRFDRDRDLQGQITAIAPHLVIDAAGPFQETGGDPYRVAKACIATKAHYIDIADGRAFVTGIDCLDAVARQAGITVISGASSVPALTGAAVAELVPGLAEIAEIDIALSASNRATAGPNVNAAILSYVGQKLRMRRAGGWATRHGWGELVARDFALPGRAPIDNRLVALCDVPDLDLLPRLYPAARNVIFRAGAELPLQNRALAWLGRLVRLGVLPRASPLLPWLNVGQKWMGRLGSDCSAMRVDVTGRDPAGMAQRRSWILIAEDGDGPWVPSFAAVLLARKMRDGNIGSGARTAAGQLALEDFRSLFRRFRLFDGIVTAAPQLPLYQRVMGADFHSLPPALRQMHSFLAPDRASGRAAVTRGTHLIARLIGGLFRFPPEAADVPVSVTFDIDARGETWTRDFGGHRFQSRLSSQIKAGNTVLTERFGPLIFDFDLEGDENGLKMRLSGWRCLGFPLPSGLLPRISALEAVEDGRFRFDVSIALPWGPPVIRYRGWLAPDPVTP